MKHLNLPIYCDMKNIFNDHPNSVSESYSQHLLKSISFGLKLIVIAFYSFVHAIFPFFFTNKVSNSITKLNKILQNRKDKNKE